MGEYAAPHDKLVALPGHLNHLNDDTFVEYILKEYGIRDQPAALQLMEQLDGIVMRDQQPPPDPFASQEAQRLAVHAAAKDIQQIAARLLASIGQLQANVDKFEEAVGGPFWSAIMLEEAPLNFCLQTKTKHHTAPHSICAGGLKRR